MMPHPRTLIAAIIGFLLMIASVRAATPQLINFQGRLTNTDGTPVPNSNYSIVFTIYDDPSASLPGNIKWQETHSAVPVSGGSFTVLLGAGTPPITITHDIFSSPARYLGIKVGGDSEITPRTQLVTVPYAYRTATVDSALGGTIKGNLTVSAGNIELGSSNLTSGSITKGGLTFVHNFGIDNTFVGVNAGNLTTSGSLGNTGCGSGALSSITGGVGNTASGSYALWLNTDGSWNTASGASALQHNTTGRENTASGCWALDLNTSGEDNTADGFYSLRNNTTGSNNTAVGVRALEGNGSGTRNTANGWGALELNTTGSDNTANGSSALQSNTSGASNTATGNGALNRNTTGNLNTASGSHSLYFNTTGNYNTAVGDSALLRNTDGFQNSASGNDALKNNTTGDMNTACGSAALKSNTIGTQNSAIGLNALHDNTSGNSNVACGNGALYSNVTGSNNTAIGELANVSAGGLTNATAIGNGAVVDASNKVRLGNSSVTTICGQVAFTACSDRNLKENFQPVDGNQVLKKIAGLSLTSWNYIGHDPKKFRHYGPMAQEFFSAFGRDNVGQCGDSTTINSGDMAGILIIAVQALEKRTAELSQERDLLREAMISIREQQRILDHQQTEMAELRRLVTDLFAANEGKSTTLSKK